MIFFNVDDNAYLFLGQSQAFDCCKQSNDPLTDSTFILNANIYNYNNGQNFVNINFIQDQYYPMRIVYINIEQ